MGKKTESPQEMLMITGSVSFLRRMFGAPAALGMILILAGTFPAQAQWTASDTNNAWNGYNSAFWYTGGGGYGHFATIIGGSTPDGFWQQAEEIEMAVDAYAWSKTYETGSTSGIESEVESLAEGFVTRNGDDWSSDLYDDDLMWATIAFARAYETTGNTQWLTDAENNFDTVYNRGHASNGGIYWYAAGCSGNPATGCSNTYENSAANWTFVIAGHLINNYNGGNGNYLSEAESVYTWAIANLYQSSTGQIYDGYFSSSGPVTGAYTYNYGTAIGAMSESSAGATTIGQVATYLFNDLTNYAGTTSSGYNILANYGQGASDNDGGYNGIAMRWINVANVHGNIPSADLAAAKANVTQAWSIREYSSGLPDYLMWDNWDADTPSTTSGAVYSWDCSSALVGMLDGQGW